MTQATFAENKKSMGIYHDTGVELTFSGTAGRTYTIYQIVQELCDGYDEQGEYYEYYVDVLQELQKITLEGTAGQTATGKFDFMASGEVKAVGITSGAMENASRKLTFDAPHVDIYVSVDGGAAEKLGSTEMIVPKDAGVRFRVVPREGYRVVYVSATVETKGETYAVLSLIKGEREEALPDAGMYDLYQGKVYSVKLYCGKRAAKLDAPVVSGKALSARIDPEDDTRVLLETMSSVKNGIKSTLKLTGTVTAGSSL